MSCGVIAGASNRCGLRLDRRSVARKRAQHFLRFADDLRADAVTGKDRDLHRLDSVALCANKKKRRLVPGAAFSINGIYASQGWSVSRFVSNARISSACASVK